jgi:hypothetical protein
MALQKSLVPLILGTSIDTKTDSKLVQSSKLLELENAYIDKFGSLRKRNGNDPLGNAPSGGRSITTFKDELVLMTSERIYSYNDSTDVWVDKGYLADVRTETSQIIRNTNKQNASSCASLNNITVYAWEDNDGSTTTVHAAVFDAQTGLAIISDYAVETISSTRPKIIACVRYIYIFYTQGTNIKSVRIDTTSSTPVFESPVTLTSSGATDPIFDIVRYGTTTNMVMVYKNSANKVNIGYVIESGNFGGPSDGVPSAITDVFTLGAYVMQDCITLIVEAGGTIKVVFCGSSVNGLHDIYYGSLNFDFTGIAKFATNEVAGLAKNNVAIYAIDTNSFRLWYEFRETIKYKVYIQYIEITGLASSPTLGSATLWVRSVGIVSKPFSDSSGNIYLICAFETTLQPTYFVMKFISSTKALVVNTISKSEAYGHNNRYGNLSEPFEIETDKRIFSSTVRYQIQIVDSQVTAVTGIQSNKILLENTDSIESRTLGNNLHIANGQVQIYDGQSAVEHGFNYYPENLELSGTTIGSSSNPIGIRNYIAVYVWIDAQGQLHQSTTSVPYEVNNASAYDSNDIDIPTLQLTEKKQDSGRTPVYIGLYRTVPNGTVFYSVTPSVVALENDTSVSYVTYVDSTLDTDIIDNPILYTTGNILDNDTPNASNIVEVFNNRLILSDQSDENLIQYSKQYVKGNSVEISDGLEFRIDQGIGSVKALGRLDEKLILFKASSIYAQVGNGPTPTGAQNDFVTPVLISSDVGCSDPQSVVVTKNGLMFKSNKGYYLLNRSLQTEYIGQDVHEYNDLTVTGAQVVPDLDQVRIVHSDGVCLVYNYLYNQWYTFTNLQALACTVWKNKFVVLKTSNEVWKESDGYLDAGTYVQMRLKTAWIQLAQLQGAQRIYSCNVLGKYLSTHSIEIKLRYDFDDSVRETLHFVADTALGSSYYGEGYYGEEAFYGGADGVEQFRIRPSIQKCQAIQYEMRDYDSEITDGGSLELTGLTLQVGIKQGLFKLRDGKNATTSA